MQNRRPPFPVQETGWFSIARKGLESPCSLLTPEGEDSSISGEVTALWWHFKSPRWCPLRVPGSPGRCPFVRIPNSQRISRVLSQRPSVAVLAEVVEDRVQLGRERAFVPRLPHGGCFCPRRKLPLGCLLKLVPFVARIMRPEREAPGLVADEVGSLLVCDIQESNPTKRVGSFSLVFGKWLRWPAVFLQYSLCSFISRICHNDIVERHSWIYLPIHYVI